MKRIVLTILTIFFSVGLYAQVGINTEDPKASLDIVANTAESVANGLLVPRLTAEQVNGMENQVDADQNALMVYVTKTFTTIPIDLKYTDIDAIGYYYWDAKDNAGKGKWKKLGNTVYTAGVGIEIGGNVVSATGLERSVVTRTYYNDYYAWNLIGRDKQVDRRSGFGKPQYQSLGIGAVDLSHGVELKTASPTGASGNFSFASGYGTTASGNFSTAIGYRTNALGPSSIAIGTETTASNTAVAMGYSTNALGYISTTMGFGTTALGNTSIAMGSQTTALGNYSTAMGRTTTASGLISTAMGNQTTALGDYSTAMGKETTASGTVSTSMGFRTNALGGYSTAMGKETTASGAQSTAMGGYTEAVGDYSVAMGKQTTAKIAYSTVMGYRGDTGNNLILAVANNGNIFGVTQEGDVYAKGTFVGSQGNISDGRLKTDVAPLPSASATLAELRPVQYHWNAEAKAWGNEDTRLQYGFIAQEVEKVLPFLVNEHSTLRDENKKIKSLNYIGIIPVLTKALQEKSQIIDKQQNEIEVLKSQLQAEKARNDQQEERLRAIEAKLK